MRSRSGAGHGREAGSVDDDWHHNQQQEASGERAKGQKPLVLLAFYVWKVHHACTHTSSSAPNAMITSQHTAANYRRSEHHAPDSTHKQDITPQNAANLTLAAR